MSKDYLEKYELAFKDEDYEITEEDAQRMARGYEPKVECITREEIDLQLNDCETEYGFNPSDIAFIMDRVFKYIEHLELQLDAKDIPRKMSEGVDHRIRSLAQRVLELEANQKDK